MKLFFDEINFFSSLASPLTKKGLNNYECSFKLKSEQASEISLSREFKGGKLEFNSQIHLRFCTAESFTPQDDYLPLNLIIRLIKDKS